ncbi:hypothetical protein [Streptomyces canus]|uniref:hypothetical protein n=1 Tax=Streptomyces canus TaxID=58343 RepID=UPI002E2A6EC9|nr:hypothetical protein [Streptomyces canus]
MHIGEVQVLLNHPLVLVGPTGELEEFASTPLSGSIPSGFSHVAVPARAQVSSVLVRMWNGAHPSTGVVVFDSSMELSDGGLAVFDVDRLSRFVRTVGKPGAHHLTIRVDDPTRASRVDIIVDRGPGRVSLNRVSDYPLPEIDGVSGELTPADMLNMTLSGVSLAKARLVTALDLVISEWEQIPSARRAQVNAFRIQLITEWLKNVYPEVKSESWRDVSAFIGAEIAGEGGRAVGVTAVPLARRVIRMAEDSC